MLRETLRVAHTVHCPPVAAGDALDVGHIVASRAASFVGWSIDPGVDFGGARLTSNVVS